MGNHDELLKQGPQTAPEPETAEVRSKRVGRRGLAGGAVAGGAMAAKFGALKFFIWLFAVRGTVNLLHLGAWGALLALIAVIGVALALRARREG